MNGASLSLLKKLMPYALFGGRRSSSRKKDGSVGLTVLTRHVPLHS
jgi:hypothetical protein